MPHPRQSRPNRIRANPRTSRSQRVCSGMNRANIRRAYRQSAKVPQLGTGRHTSLGVNMQTVRRSGANAGTERWRFPDEYRHSTHMPQGCLCKNRRLRYEGEFSRYTPTETNEAREPSSWPMELGCRLVSLPAMRCRVRPVWRFEDAPRRISKHAHIFHCLPNKLLYLFPCESLASKL
jgi:hypothetical protein